MRAYILKENIKWHHVAQSMLQFFLFGFFFLLIMSCLWQNKCSFSPWSEQIQVAQIKGILASGGFVGVEFSFSFLSSNQSSVDEVNNYWQKQMCLSCPASFLLQETGFSTRQIWFVFGLTIALAEKAVSVVLSPKCLLYHHSKGSKMVYAMAKPLR